jgi:GAF domain-containing protein
MQILVGANPDIAPLSGILAVVFAVLAPLSEFGRGLKNAAAARAREGHDLLRYSQFNLAVKSILTPLSHYLGEIANAKDSDREALVRAMGQKVVQSLIQVVGKTDGERESLRSAYYAVDGVGPTEHLALKSWDGRPARRPRKVFKPGTPELADLMPLVRDDRIRRIPNNETSVVQPSRPGDYTSVICCGVNIDGRGLGLISIDSPTESAFTDDDEVFVTALAKIYGAAVSLLPRYQAAR